MGGNADSSGLDNHFRRKGFELIKSRIHQEHIKKSGNPVTPDSVNDYTKKLEQAIFVKSTSRQDYVHRIEVFTKEKNVPAESCTGNQLVSSSIQMPGIQPNPAQQNVDGNRQVQQNTGVQNLQFGQQNGQSGQQNRPFGQRNVVGRPTGYSIPQKNGTINNQSLMSVTQVSNPQGQRNQVQDRRVHVSEVSSSHFRPPSQMPAATASTFLSNPGATNTDQFEHLIAEYRGIKSLYKPEFLKRYNTYKHTLGHWARSGTVSDREKLKKFFSTFHGVIRFLSLPENQLMQLGQQKLRSHLNTVIDCYNQITKKGSTSAVNPSNQLSSRQRAASTNVTQNIVTAPTPMTYPMVSSSSIDPGVSVLGSSAGTSLLGGSVISMGQNTDLNMSRNPQVIQSSSTDQPLLQSVDPPETGKQSPDVGNDLMDLISKLDKNSSSNLTEKRTDPVDPTQKSSTSSPSTIPKKPCSKPSAQSPRINSHDSWLNMADARSKRPCVSSKLSRFSTENNEQKKDMPSIPVSQSMTTIFSIDTPSTPVTRCSSANDEQKKDTPSITASQSMPTILSIDTPSTPVTPCSVPKENGELETIIEARNSQEQTKLEDWDPFSGVSWDFPTISDLWDPVSPLQRPEKQAIDRLMDAVRSASKETLVSAVNDMRSGVIEMDELPDYAYLDGDSTPPDFDDDMTCFVEILINVCMDDEQQLPNKKLRRDIESVSRDASFPPNNQPNNDNLYTLESQKPNQQLLDEIKSTNEKLYRTVLNVVNDSRNQSTGTIVRCTYSPVAMGAAIIRSVFATESINLSIEFLVPVDYPNSPPTILDCRLPELGIGKEMTEMTKSMFNQQVRCVDPLRVGEMGEVWYLCARSVFVSYSNLHGVETLVAKYARLESVPSDS